jgi:hypothetical protein
VSLYDVSDPTSPTRLGALSLGQTWSWSEANSDDKAFTVVPAGKLILAPYNEWTDSGTESKLAMLSYADGKLTSLATLAHRGTVVRSGVNDAVTGLWILSHEQLQTVDISTPAEAASLATLAMAEYVVRYAVVGEFGVRVTWPGYSEGTSAVAVQTVAKASPNGVCLAAETFDDFSLSGMKVGNGAVLLLGQTSTSAARLIVLDAAALPEISVKADETFDFVPSQAWTWYYYYAMDTVGAMTERVRSSAKTLDASEVATVMPTGNTWMVNNDWPIVLGNGTVAVLSYGGSAANPDYGKTVLRLIATDEDRAAVVRSIDLSAAAGTSTLCRFGAVGNVIYFTKMAVEGGWGYAASDAVFTLYRVDANDASSAVLDGGVNVPGVAVRVTGDAVYTIDPYWNDTTLQWRFCSLDLSATQATLRRTLNLDTSSRSISQVIAHGGRAMINFSDGWYWPLCGYAYGAVAKASAAACEMGGSTVTTVDVTSPTALKACGTLGVDAATTAVAFSDSHVALSVDGSSQLLMVTVDGAGVPTFGSVTDLPGSLITVTMPSENTIEAICGYGGVATVALP